MTRSTNHIPLVVHSRKSRALHQVDFYKMLQAFSGELEPAVGAVTELVSFAETLGLSIYRNDGYVFCQYAEDADWTTFTRRVVKQGNLARGRRKFAAEYPHTIVSEDPLLLDEESEVWLKLRYL